MFAYEDMKITVNDYERVMQRQNSWLNHAVIDYYIKTLNRTVNERRLKRDQKIFYFNKLCYSLLTNNDNGYDYDLVKRRYRNIEFEDYRDIFFYSLTWALGWSKDMHVLKNNLLHGFEETYNYNST